MTEYFLEKYSKTDFITLQRARVFLMICLLLLVFTVLLIISHFLRGTNDPKITLPLVGLFIILILSLIFIKKGFFTLVAHFLLINFLFAGWVTMLLDPGDVLQKLDTVIYIPALLILTILIINRKKYLIHIYFIVNIGLFIGFCLYLLNDPAFSRYNISDYMIDNLVVLSFTGLICYQIFNIYTRAMQIANESKNEIQQQYDEIEQKNEELSKMHGELIQANDLLSEEKELLATTMRSIGEAVITTDMKMNIILFNRAAEKITGWLREEAWEMSPMDAVKLINEKTREPLEDPVKEAIDKGVSTRVQMDLLLLAKDGKEKAVSLNCTPITDRKSKIIGSVLVLHDVTDKTKMERELQKKSKIEALGIFAGGIAHDFNNLMTTIIGNISIASSLLDKDSVEFNLLSSAEKASQKTVNLANQLFTFAKGGEPVKKTSTIVEMIEESINFILSGSEINYKINVGKNLWNVKIDRGQIYQVIHNLILNARQSIEGIGTIEISVVNEKIEAGNPHLLGKGDYIKIGIRDTGVGIPAENQGRIFDPFFTTRKNGSGLGLAICYSIIKKHNGLITVDSIPGEGTTFYVYLPATGDSIKKESGPGKSTRRYSGRVLVLDDNEEILMVMRTMLTHLGFEVTEARTGEETIELYKSAKASGRDYACIILDLTVPGSMGGKGVIEVLKEFDPGVRAVVSSGYSNDPVMANYRDYGFLDAVRKPYNLDDIKASLEKVLRGV